MPFQLTATGKAQAWSGVPHLTAQAFFAVSAYGKNGWLGARQQVVLVDGSTQARLWKDLLAFWAGELKINFPPARLLDEEEIPRAFGNLGNGARTEETWLLPLSAMGRPVDGETALFEITKGRALDDKSLAIWLADRGFAHDPALAEEKTWFQRGDAIGIRYGARFIVNLDLGRVETITKDNAPVTRCALLAPLPAKPSKRRSPLTLGELAVSEKNALRAVWFWDQDAYDEESHKFLTRWRHAADGITFTPWKGNAQHDAGMERLSLDIEKVPTEMLADLAKEKKGWHWLCVTTGDDNWSAKLFGIDARTRAPRLQPFLAPQEKFGVMTDDLLQNFYVTPAKAGVHASVSRTPMDSRLRGNDREEGDKKKGNNKSKAEELRQEVAGIKQGDFVVHADHGIGIFSGIVTTTIGSMTRDYLLIAYAGNDKLYVPVDQTDRVEKYLGAAAPKVHRLHGGEWAQAEGEARKQTRAMAAELLSLYAERQLLPAERFSKESSDFESALAASFPYDLTPDQAAAVDEILHDLSTGRPMERLLAGDVGFGKTEVALRAAARVIAAGGQVAWLAPTTVLAQQHYDTIRERLRPLGLETANFSRLSKAADQKKWLAGLKSGATSLAVGTTRLLSDDVAFKDLALLVIDEEQRFGVADKELLKEKKKSVHILTLTATPLPRTLNLSLSGVRDISFLKTPPPGRLPIVTKIVQHDDLVVKEAIERELARDGQAYVLHNDVATMQVRKHELQQLFPDVAIAVAHGQMGEKELLDAMHAFDAGDAKILLCSTIIENGIDLPHANTLVVENATDFGLSQLYQIRGRIGRSPVQAYAYLTYDRQKLGGNAADRLSALEEFNKPGDGLVVAMRDMEIRGIGNVLGSEQSGRISGVGLSLFTRLLEEAVDELKTGAVRPVELAVKVMVPLSCGLPETERVALLPVSEKLKLYQAFGSLRDEAALREAVGAWENSVGLSENEKMQPRWVGLQALWTLKLLGRALGLAEIRYDATGPTGNGVTMNFRRNLPDGGIAAAQKEYRRWEFDVRAAHLPKSLVREDWLDQSVAILRLLAAR